MSQLLRKLVAVSVRQVVPVKPRLFSQLRLTQLNGCGQIRLPYAVKVFSSRPSLNGCRLFCTSQDLTLKKCVPCNSRDMQPMTEQAANELMSKVSGWSLENEGGTLKLSRSWKVKSFTNGLEFFQAVAEVAEAEGHHPDLHLVGWNNVNIDIWTHAVGGLTENDFILAAKINMLSLQHLLRRKPTTV